MCDFSKTFPFCLNKVLLSYLCAGVLWVAVQISEHTGEGVNVSIDFGVIAHWLLRTAVLKTEQHKKHVST